MIFQIYLFFFLSFSISGLSAVESPHALYLSVLKIDHHSTKNEAEVLVKVFTDDLESVIRAAYEDKFQLATPASFCTSNKPLIETYFKDHFSCHINSIPSHLTFVAATLENDVYWLRFTLSVPKEWKRVKLTAPFFTEIFSTQSNIIHLLYGDQKRFARLTKSTTEVVFEF